MPGVCKGIGARCSFITLSRENVRCPYIWRIVINYRWDLVNRLGIRSCKFGANVYVCVSVLVLGFVIFASIAMKGIEAQKSSDLVQG